MNFKNLHEMNQYYERMNHDGLLNHIRIYGNGNNGLGYKPDKHMTGVGIETYDNLISKYPKYGYYAVTKKQVIELSTGNDLQETTDKALEKLEPHMDKMIGKNIIMTELKNTYDAFKRDKLDFVGGAIAIYIKEGTIISPKRIKLSRAEGNNRFYFSKDYIREHHENLMKDVKQAVREYSVKGYNSPFDSRMIGGMIGGMFQEVFNMDKKDNGVKITKPKINDPYIDILEQLLIEAEYETIIKPENETIIKPEKEEEEEVVKEEEIIGTKADKEQLQKEIQTLFKASGLGNIWIVNGGGYFPEWLENNISNSTLDENNKQALISKVETYYITKWKTSKEATETQKYRLVPHTGTQLGTLSTTPNNDKIVKKNIKPVSTFKVLLDNIITDAINDTTDNTVKVELKAIDTNKSIITLVNGLYERINDLNKKRITNLKLRELFKIDKIEDPDLELTIALIDDTHENKELDKKSKTNIKTGGKKLESNAKIITEGNTAERSDNYIASINQLLPTLKVSENFPIDVIEEIKIENGNIRKGELIGCKDFSNSNLSYDSMISINKIMMSEYYTAKKLEAQLWLQNGDIDKYEYGDFMKRLNNDISFKRIFYKDPDINYISIDLQIYNLGIGYVNDKIKDLEELKEKQGLDFSDSQLLDSLTELSNRNKNQFDFIYNDNREVISMKRVSKGLSDDQNKEYSDMLNEKLKLNEPLTGKSYINKQLVVQKNDPIMYNFTSDKIIPKGKNVLDYYKMTIAQGNSAFEKFIKVPIGEFIKVRKNEIIQKRIDEKTEIRQRLIAINDKIKKANMTKEEKAEADKAEKKAKADKVKADKAESKAQEKAKADEAKADKAKAQLKTSKTNKGNKRK